MKGCLKTRSGTSSPGESRCPTPPTPSHTCSKKCVVFATSIREDDVHTADKWDRTPVEPARNLTYEDILELKEIQNSLPRAQQCPEFYVTTRTKQYLLGVPVALLPIFTDSSCSGSEEHSPSTSAFSSPLPSGHASPVRPSSPTTRATASTTTTPTPSAEWTTISFRAPNKVKAANPPPPAPVPAPWTPPHLAHLAPRNLTPRSPLPQRPKPAFSFLPLVDNDSSASPYPSSIPSPRSVPNVASSFLPLAAAPSSDTSPSSRASCSPTLTSASSGSPSTTPHAVGVGVDPSPSPSISIPTRTTSNSVLPLLAHSSPQSLPNVPTEPSLSPQTPLNSVPSDTSSSPRRIAPTPSSPSSSSCQRNDTDTEPETETETEPETDPPTPALTSRSAASMDPCSGISISLSDHHHHHHHPHGICGGHSEYFSGCAHVIDPHHHDATDKKNDLGLGNGSELGMETMLFNSPGVLGLVRFREEKEKAKRSFIVVNDVEIDLGDDDDEPSEDEDDDDDVCSARVDDTALSEARAYNERMMSLYDF